MISAGKARNATYDHQSSGLAEARSHHLSTFLRTQHGDSLEGDMTPADSASDVDYRSVTSSPKKANGFARKTTERRAESVRISVKQNARTRARSPPKESMTKITDKKDFREFQPPRLTSRLGERLLPYPLKNERVLPETASGRPADLG